ACVRSGRRATHRPGAPRSRPSPPPRAGATISCLRSSVPSRRTRPSAKSRTPCAACSVNTESPMSDNREPISDTRDPISDRLWDIEYRASDIEYRASDAALLSVEHLTTVFDLPAGPAAAVSDVSFHVDAGETLCLVGESGSGKSVTALSILRLVQPPGRIAGGRIVFKGRDLLTLGEREMQKVRGAGIALVFQEPMTALNPVLTIGNQIEETLAVHGIAKGR